MTASQSTSRNGRYVNRALFLEIIETAQFMELHRFTRQALLAWLAAYPGDLPTNLLYAKVLIKAGHPDQAIPILERLCRADPEYLEAAQARLDAELRLSAEGEQRSKLRARQKNGAKGSSVGDALGCLLALGGEPGPKGSSKQATRKTPSVPVWSQQIKFARQSMLYKENSRLKTILALDKAEQTLHEALAIQIPTPLAGVTHLQLLRLKGMPIQSLQTLASHYHQRWPDCLQFNLLLAEALLESNEAEQGVNWLHQSASRDITGQVARRLWGEEHPYRSLWPCDLEFWLDVPIPAEVATALGWNQLPEGVRQARTEHHHNLEQPVDIPKTEPELAFAWKSFTPSDKPPNQNTKRPTPPVPDLPETLRSVQAELDQVAARLNQPSLARADGRFPVYVVMSTRSGLETHYSPQAAAQLDIQMKRLVEAVGKRQDWRAILFYADEGWQDEVAPAKNNDPWAIKLALADLDFALGCNGEMIGAVLIVGGPDVVPFHHLPNPVDDTDHDVPSDNPYGTRDENYFIPEWAVGRLPGDASPEADPLLKVLGMVADYHAYSVKQTLPRSWIRRLWQVLTGWLRRQPGQEKSGRARKPSFGFTAAAWRQASLKVFRPIGEARSLQASPPIDVTNGGKSPLPSARLGYFNLHGLVDAVEWYGQSNPAATIAGNGGGNVDYPVALRPEDVINSGHAPEVVFSEACYGAHILGRKVEEALALKFLQSGSVAVIGSTSAAYGSIDFPLTAADFLGHAFWNQLKQGFPAGEALRRAKIALAREMHNRQGYLDGEDQKTLISFVLYGDPLVQPLGKERQIKTILRPMKPVQSLRTVCDRVRDGDNSQSVSPEIEMQVKKVVKKYLPGMAGAQITISGEHLNCELEGHECPTAQLGHIGTPPCNYHHTQPNRKVVVLSKQVKSAAHLHHHYARLTLDKDNRLVKLVVSR